jgi:hypothetical protein
MALALQAAIYGVDVGGIHPERVDTQIIVFQIRLTVLPA